MSAYDINDMYVACLASNHYQHTEDKRKRAWKFGWDMLSFKAQLDGMIWLICSSNFISVVFL